MVFVKVRETYDLKTTKGRMTVIGVHTPKPDIIKANFPGLLMQCKAYRPVSADVRIACASALPLDPLGVGTEGTDVIAPEDLFNPILYKACSNFGMSQIEARINQLAHGSTAVDVDGNSASVDVDTVTTASDDFAVYYGFLSNAHEWRHANPQSGLEMNDLRPLVYEVLYNVGDQSASAGVAQMGVGSYAAPAPNGNASAQSPVGIRGNSKPLPFINCTSYSSASATNPFQPFGGADTNLPPAQELDVPWINCVVGAIIVPPSRLHELFYRMVIEWTIEFSQIRPLSEITNWTGLSRFASLTHYQNYDYETTKQALTGTDETVFEADQTMVSANVDIKKVM